MIKIRKNNNWENAGDIYSEMFNKYREQNRYSEIPYTENGITISRDMNDPYNGVYLHIDTNKYPICDWNDVKIFLTDRNDVNWYSARNYQTWSYFDFIYDNKNRKNYRSPGSIYMPGNTIIELDNLQPNIVFKLIRNSNNSISFERNDMNHSHFRICDNEWARLGYRGFYTRLTMDPGMIVIPPSNLSSNKLELPDNLILSESTDENEQCIMCVNYKVNINFLPCNHAISCSECYLKMEQNVCPLCKINIISITKK
jgi:hypothetical protein